MTATYAGLRAATEHTDYVVEVDSAQRYLVLGGIRSTGLTASMALAEHAAELLHGRRRRAAARDELPRPRSMPTIGERTTRPYESADAIAHDTRTETIVCFCERVTRGEIRDALAGPLPPSDLDGLRRRTRATMMGAARGSSAAPRSTRCWSEARDDHADEQVDVVVVGAGPAGLTAAASCAARGAASVVVLERERGRGHPTTQRPHRLRGPRPASGDVRPGVRPASHRPAVRAGPTSGLQSMVTGWAGDRSLWVTSPAGRYRARRPRGRPGDGRS